MVERDLFMQQDELLRYRGHYFGNDTAYMTLVKHHHQLIADLEAEQHGQS